MRKQAFNLIEILISMIVIIFAMFIIISFLPLANQQQSEALNQTHLANVAQDMVDYIKSQPQDALNTVAGVATPIEDQYNFINSINSSKLTSTLKRSVFGQELSTNGSTVIKGRSGSETEAFLIQSVNSINGIDVKEAEVEARIWRIPASLAFSNQRADSDGTPAVGSPTNGQTYALLEFNNITDQGRSISPGTAVDPQNVTSTLKARTTRIMIEFSWPLNKTYDERKKETIFFDQQVVTQN